MRGEAPKAGRSGGLRRAAATTANSPTWDKVADRLFDAVHSAIHFSQSTAAEVARLAAVKDAAKAELQNALARPSFRSELAASEVRAAALEAQLAKCEQEVANLSAAVMKLRTEMEAADAVAMGHLQKEFEDQRRGRL